MKRILLIASLSLTTLLNAQSYAPAAGVAGTTAIPGSSSQFVGWATGATVVRGPQNITNPTGPLATVGTADDATGPANGSAIVSLGDGGSAVMTFATPIANGPGFDFAVFENSFSDTFLELAFVEVSSDGINFFRFPSHSETQTTTQIGGFGNLDCRYINNLAGKYRANFGTPFDLSDIPNDPLLNKDRITHVKVIDVIGTIDPVYATHDSHGNIINEPYATPFASGGFDLDAVGVINQSTLGIHDFDTTAFRMYPNPASDVVYLESDEATTVVIYDLYGRVVKSLNKGNHNQIPVSGLASGTYMIEVATTGRKEIKKLIIR
ncbi:MULTISPECIES: T9SS type A sorting domain-containing protein [unclassified Flavobacterium]|uniref:T9SS type A sorting domain-containing protein n=1 Tax=unclassified Flavobacterium TaxID=196869 RepID=UPI00086AB79E|nr:MULTISPECIES: T9SS type A sorting domain-containing protein [unclassified Flavobacterium]MBN9286007.1 T9SS type A sorting domain-containing protein [Flavobacterium sp.]ODS77526.1 MAG: secretion protein [Chryseobacterium sp. SCN 40-13]OJV69063.1 MAG: secretion protein [Flavobacterium sp. 40-81]